LGVRAPRGPVVQFGVHAALSRRRSRVQIPSGPLHPTGAGSSAGTSIRLKSGGSAVRSRPCPLGMAGSIRSRFAGPRSSSSNARSSGAGSRSPEPLTRARRRGREVGRTVSVDAERAVVLSDTRHLPPRTASPRYRLRRRPARHATCTEHVAGRHRKGDRPWSANRVAVRALRLLLTWALATAPT
jgi:hypothetical protein